MRESGQNAPPVLGPELPDLELPPNSPSTGTLPSSLSHKAWAALCPEQHLPFEVDGQIIYARAKCCAFCGNPIRLSPGGDESLIPHMKSPACQTTQREIEAEIRSATETTPENTVPAATSMYAHIYSSFFAHIAKSPYRFNP